MYVFHHLSVTAGTADSSVSIIVYSENEQSFAFSHIQDALSTSVAKHFQKGLLKEMANCWADERSQIQQINPSLV